jgi:PmbA protein
MSLREMAAWIVKQSKKAGADHCRVSVKQSRHVETICRKGTLESLKEAAEHSADVELFVAGRYASQTTSDLRRDSLGKFLSEAVAMTRLLDKDPYRTLPDPKYYKGRSKDDLGVLDKAHKSLTLDIRKETALAMERACHARGGRHSVSAAASVWDKLNSRVVATSNGFEGAHESTSYLFWCELTVKDEGDRRPCGVLWGSASHRKTLPAAASVGEMTADEALALLGAKKLKTETLPVMIQNHRVGRILNWLLRPMSGFYVQQQRSWLADRRGQRIASPKLTVVDDPLLPGGVESCSFDPEGMTARRRTMLEEGVLQEFYLNWYYARKLGMEPTVGGATNLLLTPGSRSPEQILKDLDRCLVVTDFIGGNSNTTTGDFSVGVSGTLFEKGEPAQAVAEMNIAGNNQQLWNRLVEVGNDPWLYSALRTPSLLFDNVVVSGT